MSENALPQKGMDIQKSFIFSVTIRLCPSQENSHRQGLLLALRRKVLPTMTTE